MTKYHMFNQNFRARLIDNIKTKKLLSALGACAPLSYKYVAPALMCGGKKAPCANNRTKATLDGESFKVGLGLNDIWAESVFNNSTY